MISVLTPNLKDTWIKICGITRHHDALAAAELGADAIGLNFYPRSPRAISLDSMPAILTDLPAQVKVVALFVNPAAQQVQAVIDTGLVDILQFHGEEQADYCVSFGLPYMKALRVDKRQAGERSLNPWIAEFESAELILLDSFDPAARGGTGKVFDWDLAQHVTPQIRAKLVLAGGLNPDNIQRAVSQVRPFGVDVSSGVEASPGQKDVQKMKMFIEGVRSV